MSTLADRVKLARDKKGMTQQEVAKKSGMSQPSYYKIENGKTNRTTFINSLFSSSNSTISLTVKGIIMPNPSLEKSSSFKRNFALATIIHSYCVIWKSVISKTTVWHKYPSLAISTSSLYVL